LKSSDVKWILLYLWDIGVARWQSSKVYYFKIWFNFVSKQ